MFDFIGLFIGFAICAILASLVGLVLGLAAWLILRRQLLVRFLLALIAATIPVASLFYMAGFAVLFSFVVPGQSELLFNGVSEELPNGYRLTALGKMPEFGDIEPIDKHHLVPQLREPVGRSMCRAQWSSEPTARTLVNLTLLITAISHSIQKPAMSRTSRRSKNLTSSREIPFVLSITGTTTARSTRKSFEITGSGRFGWFPLLSSPFSISHC